MVVEGLDYVPDLLRHQDFNYHALTKLMTTQSLTLNSLSKSSDSAGWLLQLRLTQRRLDVRLYDCFVRFEHFRPNLIVSGL